MEIYHNPRCSKSRAGLSYLEEKGYEFEIIKYLEEGLSVHQLSEIVKKIGKSPFDLVRAHEKDFIQNYKGKQLSNNEWLKIISENLKLLHRPIIVNGNKAVLAQPPEMVEKII
jgi:arsenate reductase (glutaredoxin)